MKMYKKRDVLKCTDPRNYGYYMIINDDGKYMTGIKLTTEWYLSNIEWLKTGFRFSDSAIERTANIFIGIFLINKNRVIEKVGEVSDEKYANIIGCLISFCMGNFTFSRENGIKYDIAPFTFSVNAAQLINLNNNNYIQPQTSEISPISEEKNEEKQVETEISIIEESDEKRGFVIADILAQKYKVTTKEQKNGKTEKKEKKKTDPLPWFEKPTKKKTTAKDYDAYNTALMKQKDLEAKQKREAEELAAQTQRDFEEAERLENEKETTKTKATNKNVVLTLSEKEQQKWNELYHSYLENLDSDTDQKLDTIIHIFGNSSGYFSVREAHKTLILKDMGEFKIRKNSILINKEEAIAVLNAKTSSAIIKLCKTSHINNMGAFYKIKRQLTELMLGVHNEIKERRKLDDKTVEAITEMYTSPENYSLSHMSQELKLPITTIQSVISLLKKNGKYKHSVSEKAPLRGAKELLDEFEFGDEKDPIYKFKSVFAQYSDVELEAISNDNIIVGDTLEEQFITKLALNRIIGRTNIIKLFSTNEQSRKYIEWLKHYDSISIEKLIKKVYKTNTNSIAKRILQLITIVQFTQDELNDLLENNSIKDLYENRNGIIVRLVEVVPYYSLFFRIRAVREIQLNYHCFTDARIEEIKNLSIEWEKTAPPPFKNKKMK